MSKQQNRTATVAADSCLDAVAWDARGLVPAIAQDAESGQVLMLAWMDRAALAASIDSGLATYWSRSRGRLWRKGETSGHVQHVIDIRLDCDNDAILLRVRQDGGIACHTGRASCFYQVLTPTTAGTGWVARDPVIKHPEQIYS